MSNLIKGFAGLAAAAYMGRQAREAENARLNKYRAARGKAPLELEKAPIDKAMDWVGDKFSAASKAIAPDATGAAPVAVQPDTAAPAGNGGDVGLWDRLKAGNIDDPQSEAYKRWGAGANEEAAAQQRVADLDESSRQDAADTYSKTDWDAAPDMDAAAATKLDAFEGINTPY